MFFSTYWASRTYACSLKTGNAVSAAILSTMMADTIMEEDVADFSFACNRGIVFG